MIPVTSTVRDRNFLFQRTQTNDNMITVRIDDTRNSNSKMALIVFDSNVWYFSLEENLPYWNRGNNKFRSQADTHEQAFNDMLAYIRSN